MGALDGLKVIDLSRVLGGPYCTQMLADHGATVIKIEPPQGDETRDWGPPFQGDAASYFIGVNRNKQGIALDLSREEGRKVLLTMLADADVLVENFKPGTLDRWGIGYEQFLSEEFPRLIHCRVSGFGSEGPLGGLPGYDAVVQAMCGLMSVNGEKGGSPLRLGVPVVDIVTGLNAAIGVLLALQERQSSGRGQFVEATLFDSGLSLMHPHIPNFLLSEKVPGPTGNAHPNICPYDSFPTRTVNVFLAVGNDAQFARMCTHLGASAMAHDPRFKTNSARLSHATELRSELQNLMASLDGVELASQLMNCGVPCGPVLDVRGALEHPHTSARNRIVHIDQYRGVASPISLSRTPPTYRTTPPSFGQDTSEVLRSAGLLQDAVQEMARTGIAPNERAI